MDMMKKIYVVYVREENKKYYAVADAIKMGENLAAYIQRYNSNICHLCESRKEAEELAITWNESYKENGTNLF